MLYRFLAMLRALDLVNFSDQTVFRTFYTPVEDGTYYVINCGGRVGSWAGVRAASPILCPEHISKTMLATVMKLHAWIDLIKAECSAQEP